jgi:dihydrofolate reductase
MDSRKVVVYEFMTLDGVAEDVAGFFTEWDDHEVDAAGAAVIETQDAIILGRRTYDEWPRSGLRATSSRSRHSSTESRNT